MPVYYNISPEFKIRYFICEGLVTARELFDAASLSDLDARRKWGMTTIIEFSDQGVDFSLKDMRYAIDMINKKTGESLEVEPQVMITANKSLRLAADALRLLPSSKPLKLYVYHTIQDAIVSLGLSDQMEEILQFCQKSKLSKA